MPGSLPGHTKVPALHGSRRVLANSFKDLLRLPEAPADGSGPVPVRDLRSLARGVEQLNSQQDRRLERESLMAQVGGEIIVNLCKFVREIDRIVLGRPGSSSSSPGVSISPDGAGPVFRQNFRGLAASFLELREVDAG